LFASVPESVFELSRERPSPPYFGPEYTGFGPKHRHPNATAGEEVQVPKVDDL